MARKADVPSAWDDDWETQADKAKDTPFSGGAPLNAATPEAKPVLLSRAERLARHEEQNRRLWESADKPEEFSFLSVGSGSGAPIASSNSTGISAPTVMSPANAFRPAMKVLSRKPAPQVIRRLDPVTGLEKLTIHDDAAEAEAEAAAAAARRQETPEQIRQRQQREREAKQRKYDEARAKIFGEPLPASGSNTNINTNAPTLGSSSSLASSRQASPIPKGSAGPGANNSHNNHNNHNNHSSSNIAPQSSPHHNYNGREPRGGGGGRGRGRGQGQGSRGGGDVYGRGQQQHDGSFNRRHHQQQQHSSGSGAAAGGGGSPSNTAAPATTSTRELYDPNYSPKPSQQRRQGVPHYYNSNNNNNSGSDTSPFPSRAGTPREDECVVRGPRGPDGSGRGGFGFSRRGSPPGS